ncbi:hypothetical protein BLOT_012362 [Blomia tropicalis]|nr:hypothetical protein BLOT_012362 [Blomia tropicalis]
MLTDPNVFWIGVRVRVRSLHDTSRVGSGRFGSDRVALEKGPHFKIVHVFIHLEPLLKVILHVYVMHFTLVTCIT